VADDPHSRPRHTAPIDLSCADARACRAERAWTALTSSRPENGAPARPGRAQPAWAAALDVGQLAWLDSHPATCVMCAETDAVRQTVTACEVHHVEDVLTDLTRQLDLEGRDEAQVAPFCQQDERPAVTTRTFGDGRQE
jgi:hypothetical protein